MADAGDEREWTFSLEDVGPEGARQRSLEPGAPSREGVVFFLLGVATALVVLWAMVP
ncbi:MAG: hypothetical protein ABEJ42_07615 [Halobacteriaceae archaeon]